MGTLIGWHSKSSIILVPVFSLFFFMTLHFTQMNPLCAYPILSCPVPLPKIFFYLEHPSPPTFTFTECAVSVRVPPARGQETGPAVHSRRVWSWTPWHLLSRWFMPFRAQFLWRFLSHFFHLDDDVHILSVQKYVLSRLNGEVYCCE